MIKHQKPASFYKTFDRKAKGQKVTHYCPGCGHGTAHKLLAECIDELGIQDQSIFCSPVGCSVFGYYYFDTGNIQCSHGRAPAVATGIRRTLPEAILICYQGDGDLAAIGTSEIIHAANRGENLSVFFINNAIYGMTGGQMAPTTLLGQQTMTTPEGRSALNDGSPIDVSQLLNALGAPAYIERVSLASAAQVLKAKRVFKKALLNQIEKRGFSFVEILSPCPINWKMSPVEARKWLKANLEPAFPVGNYRDRSLDTDVASKTAPRPFMTDTELLSLLHIDKSAPLRKKRQSIPEHHVKISGFGGQGVMSAGILLANCAMYEGANTSWLPSYGPEMRGGTANSSIIVSEQSIGAPVIDKPTALIAMNLPSLDTFETTLQPDGIALVNSSIIPRKVKRKDIKAYYVPASEIASREGLLAAANVVMLTIFALATNVIELETLKTVIPLSIKNKKYIDLNLALVQKAIDFYDQYK